jgi:hypothetical protein
MEKKSLDPIEKYESLDQKTLNMIRNNLGAVGALVCDLGLVDLAKGAGVISGSSKCIWTEKGHRVTVSLVTGGGFIASKSKDVDPLHDPAARP